MKGRAIVVGLVLALGACGGNAPPPAAAPGGSADEAKWPADDQSMCDRFVHWKRDTSLEVSETAGPGSFKPNIRRVFKSVGEHENSHPVLMCREIDTNL